MAQAGRRLEAEVPVAATPWESATDEVERRTLGPLHVTSAARRRPRRLAGAFRCPGERDLVGSAHRPGCTAHRPGSSLIGLYDLVGVSHRPCIARFGRNRPHDLVSCPVAIGVKLFDHRVGVGDVRLRLSQSVVAVLSDVSDLSAVRAVYGLRIEHTLFARFSRSRQRRRCDQGH